MLHRRRLTTRAEGRTVRHIVVLAVLAALAACLVLVAVVSRGGLASALVADPLALSLQGVEVSSGYSGDVGTGASFTAIATDVDPPSAAPPNIEAPSAILLSMDTGRVLFSQSPDERHAMASTTKIMTALCVLDDLELEEEVAASAGAEAADESQIWLKEGEVLTVEELLYALLVGSANDAAVALAEASAGSVDAFVAEMNKKTGELGLQDTHFANPHGLDAPGHYSSARDLAALARYAMKDSEFRKLVGTRTCTIPGSSQGSSRSLTNHNVLLEEGDWVTGVKTGFTDDAGYCLVASGEKSGVSVVSVVVGEHSKEACWSDSKALLEYGFTQCRHMTLITQGTAVAEAGIPDDLDKKLRLITKEPGELNLCAGEEVVVTVTIDSGLTLPVQAGEVLGTLVLTVGGETLKTIPLVADTSCDRPTLGSKLRHFWSRLVQ
jgi:D-alanyl-D-alanine carboxypeptidase (penicillin-binding protein 5/6)